MSYILDALKKAEEARSRGKAPDLFAVQAADAPAEHRSLWPWLIGVALVLNGAALFYWFQASGRGNLSANLALPGKPAPAASLPVEVPGTKAPVVADPSLPILPPTGAPAPKQPEAIATVTRPAKAVEGQAAPTRQEAKKTAQESAPRTATGKDASVGTPAATPSPATAPPPAPAERTEPPPERVAMLAELPPGVQQEVPKMVVAMHMYSGKPANRLVSINDRTLHEGDELSPGLKLVEVTPDGMIFSYKGYRFKKGIN